MTKDLNTASVCFQILPPFGRLNDNWCQQVYSFVIQSEAKNLITPTSFQELNPIDMDWQSLSISPSSPDSIPSTLSRER